jgi:cob(I)alamin adenosyltransferase
MKFYTGKGDEGFTGLIGDERVLKSDLRLETIGTLDELNAFIGQAKATITHNDMIQLLESVQRDLYLIMANLADYQGKIKEKVRFEEDRVEFLEANIERIAVNVEIPKDFILPGSTREAAILGICRTVTRRAERRVVDLNEKENLGNSVLLQYLNRLSSLMFLLEVNYSKRKQNPLA